MCNPFIEFIFLFNFEKFIFNKFLIVNSKVKKHIFKLKY